MEIKEPSETVIIKYSSYTPAQKKATQKYRENNKEKVNEQRKKYYQTRKEKDPQFLEYKRVKAKEYYMKKKLIESIKVLPTPSESEVIISKNPIEESITIKKPDINGVVNTSITEPGAVDLSPNEATPLGSFYSDESPPLAVKPKKEKKVKVTEPKDAKPEKKTVKKSKSSK